MILTGKIIQREFICKNSLTIFSSETIFFYESYKRTIKLAWGYTYMNKVLLLHSSFDAYALIECLWTSCMLRAFRMCGTWILTSSPPFPRIWSCREPRDPRSVEPTWPVCRKSIGWPIIDRSIRGRLLWSCSCSATQEKSWNQNSPAILEILTKYLDILIFTSWDA